MFESCSPIKCLKDSFVVFHVAVGAKWEEQLYGSKDGSCLDRSPSLFQIHHAYVSANGQDKYVLVQIKYFRSLISQASWLDFLKNERKVKIE
jgi:hypothetical protein